MYLMHISYCNIVEHTIFVFTNVYCEIYLLTLKKHSFWLFFLLFFMLSSTLYTNTPHCIRDIYCVLCSVTHVRTTSGVSIGNTDNSETINIKHNSCTVCA